MEWTTSTAQHHARAGQLEVWIHAYLATGEWANPGLSAGLRRQQRWWRGPLEVTLTDLERVCGPEAHMEYRQDAMTWEQAITRLQRGLRDPFQVPPLIVEYRRGGLSVRDGNHRHEAMRRSGWQTCGIMPPIQVRAPSPPRDPRGLSPDHGGHAHGSYPFCPES